MPEHNRPIFLLGGRDLEMEEIKRVLTKHKAKYFDNALTWQTANLSAYKDKLNKHTTYYAIELNIDLEGYDNVKVIDHHGELDGNDASLLQVLKILDIPPTRDQKLIVANDARYIEGMKCICATRSEIANIRKRDREAQKIILHDDTLAKADTKNRTIEQYISIIYANTPHFSAITDSLYFDFSKEERTKQSIIYNNDKVVFYGFESSYIKSICKEFDIKREQYYYGGGDTGYFGIKDKVINTKRIKEMIKHAVENRPLYSSHIFMFPFRFDYANKSIVNEKGHIHEYAFYYNNAIEDRMNFDDIKEKLKSENWVHERYSTYANPDEIHLAYNEFAYFYDYAKDTLYNRENFSDDAISSFFRKQDKDGKNLYEGEIYSINVLDKDDNGTLVGDTTYELEIQGVSLRVFHTGVAILSIELENYKYKEFKDILRINEYGRRVYPQYIGTDDEKSLQTKKSFLPNIIRIGSDKLEDFQSFNYEDIEIGKHIMQVLGRGLFTDKKSLRDEKIYDRFYIQPSLDDRMFVLSWYGNDTMAEDFSTCCNYKGSDDWYRYVFVDGGDWPTVQNNMMKKKLLSEATYDRWSAYGTIFGITRYSFVLFSSSLPTLKENKAEMVVKHMNTMYFQMATLLLANRTSILRFSDEIAALVSPTEKQKDNTSIEKHTKKIENLYDIYLKYYNRLYFKEVTHQDQGIELYDIGIKQMRIGNHVDKLDGKFEKLFNFQNLKAEKKQSKRMDNLVLWGTLFVVPSFVISLFSLDGVKEFMTQPHIAWVGLSAVVGFALALVIIDKGGK